MDTSWGDNKLKVNHVADFDLYHKLHIGYGNWIKILCFILYICKWLIENYVCI